MELLVDAADKDLVRLGDTASLVRRHYGPVYALARRLLADEGDSRDAAQETFVRAIGHLKEFDTSRSSRAWIFAIASNHIRDLLRRRKPVPFGADAEEVFPDLSLPEEALFRREDRDRILAAVDRLPFDWKIVVTLMLQQDLAYPEIAEVLPQKAASYESDATLCEGTRGSWASFRIARSPRPRRPAAP